MTIEEWIKENCSMCGSQRCYADRESIASCGRYNGEIEGLPKVKSAMDELRERKEKAINLLEKIIQSKEFSLTTDDIVSLRYAIGKLSYK
jgi:hypothetical protein